MADYKLVEGYDNALNLICSMRKCRRSEIYMCESIIRYGDIEGSVNYWEGPDNKYHEIIFLVMRNQYGYLPVNMDKLKEKAREDVRTGRLAVRPR